ncbi:hypothetical protein ACFWPH_28390 [Nocardia sp. NPDC058499]|uniref:hypothetical protein n=1 Tax=Nocardia sp. NPDC058499 TaxID=3346530 RepID=UPI0036551B76
MTFRSELERRAALPGMYSEYWCGQLPTAKALRWSFLEHRQYPGETRCFPGPLHRLAAGLAAVHFRHAGQQTDADEVLAVWLGSDEEIAELAGQIDRTAAALVPRPRATAIEYHEGLGAMISRLAYLWVHSSPFAHGIAGAPGAPMRAQILGELDAADSTYSVLACNLDRGLVRLPPPALAS